MTTMTIQEIAEDLLECARAEVSLTTNGIPPKMRVCVVPGELAIIPGCCDTLAVNLVGLFPTLEFPQPNPGTNPCVPGLTVAQFRVTLVRCVPTPDSNGKLPTCAQLADSARRWHEDVKALWKGVTCCLLDLTGEDNDGVSANLTILGPQGSCIAAQMDVQISLDDSCLCG